MSTAELDKLVELFDATENRENILDHLLSTPVRNMAAFGRIANTSQLSPIYELKMGVMVNIKREDKYCAFAREWVEQILDGGKRTPQNKYVVINIMKNYKFVDIMPDVLDYLRIDGGHLPAILEYLENYIDTEELDGINYLPINYPADNYTIFNRIYISEYKRGWHIAFNPVAEIIYDVSVAQIYSALTMVVQAVSFPDLTTIGKILFNCESLRKIYEAHEDINKDLRFDVSLNENCDILSIFIFDEDKYIDNFVLDLDNITLLDKKYNTSNLSTCIKKNVIIDGRRCYEYLSPPIISYCDSKKITTYSHYDKFKWGISHHFDAANKIPLC